MEDSDYTLMQEKLLTFPYIWKVNKTDGLQSGCNHPAATIRLLYTNDRVGTENSIFIKYFDDTEIVDLSKSIQHYLEEDGGLTWWRKGFSIVLKNLK